MKSGSCQEHGIAITILSCFQPHHKKVIRILPLMTADMDITPGVAAARRSYRQRNFFTENCFIFPNWKILLVLRAGPIRRHKLCKGNRPSLKNSYPHLTFLFSPLRDHFQGMNNLVICESIGQTQPFRGLLVSFKHPQEMNTWQHLSQGLQWVQ